MSDKDTLERITTQLVDLKNTSELSMDLAYSALLLNNTFLAEEVQQLNQKIIDLNLDLESLLLSCHFKAEESSSIIGLIQMGMAAQRISRAASEIAQVVLRGIEPHPVLRMMIESADETVELVALAEDSPLIGTSLKETEFPEETGWWVLAIKRGDRWVRPKASTVLEAGDVLIASGYADGEEDFKQLVSGRSTD